MHGARTGDRNRLLSAVIVASYGEEGDDPIYTVYCFACAIPFMQLVEQTLGGEGPPPAHTLN